MSPVASPPVQSKTFTPSPASSTPSDVPLNSLPEVGVPPTRRKLFSNRTPGGNVSASLANLEDITPEGVKNKTSVKAEISDKPEPTAGMRHPGTQPLTEIDANARKVDTKADITGKPVLSEDVIAVDTEQRATASPPRASAAQYKAAPKITSAAMSTLENNANVDTHISYAVPAFRAATQKSKRTKSSKTQSAIASKLVVGEGSIANDDIEVKSAPMHENAPAIEETTGAVAEQVDVTEPEPTRQHTAKKTSEVASKTNKASVMSRSLSDIEELNRKGQTAVPAPKQAATKRVRKPAVKAPPTSVPRILEDAARLDNEPSVGKHKQADTKSKPTVTFKEPATKKPKAKAGSLIEAAVPTWQEKAKRATRTKANYAKGNANEQTEDPVLVSSANTDINTEIEAPVPAPKKRPATHAAPKPVTRTKAAPKSKTRKTAFREHPKEEEGEGDASEYDNPAPAKQVFHRPKIRESEDEEGDGDVSDFEFPAPKKRPTRARAKTIHATKSEGKAKQQDNGPDATEAVAAISKTRGSRSKAVAVSKTRSRGQLLQHEEDGHLTALDTEADTGPAPKPTATRATRTKTSTASKPKVTDDTEDMTESDNNVQPPAPQKGAITHSKTAVSSKPKPQLQAKATPMADAEAEAGAPPLKKRASTRPKTAAVPKPNPKEDSGDIIESNTRVQSLAPKKRARANATKATKATATTKSKAKGKVTDIEQDMDPDETEIEAPPPKKRATARAKVAAAKANGLGETKVEAPIAAPAPAPAAKLPTGRVTRSKGVTTQEQKV